MLGSRLLNTSLFASDAGRSALTAAITDVLPFDSPYIVAGTPLLYPYVEDTTSVTPAWRTSLWHVSISRPNITRFGRAKHHDAVHDRGAVLL